MDKIPIIAFENILSYLSTLDRHSAIIAFNYDCSTLASHINSKISLAFEYRFRQQVIDSLIGIRKAIIKELDLSGIFWISKKVILKACSKLVNLEYFYLLGTAVVVNEQLNEFNGFPNIKFIAVAVDKYGRGIKEYWLLQRKIEADSDSDKIEFEWKFCINKVERYHKAYPIVSENWFSLIKAGATVETVSQRLKHSYTKVKYSNFLGEAEIKKMLNDLRDVKVLWIDEQFLPSVTTTLVNLEPIKYLVNLTALHIDLYDVVDIMFLKPILQSCRNLKKLSITVYGTTFSFAHLKYASECLEDLSVDMSSSVFFNVDKFFTDVNKSSSLRLRRLCLSFGQLAYEERFDVQSTLETFMHCNPQLIFVWIICLDEKIMEISRLLKAFKKEPHQLYNCKHAISNDDLPLQHWDMMNTFVDLRILPPQY